MNNQKIIIHIRDCIANNELEVALQLLRKLLENHLQLDEVIQQSGRHASMQKQLRLSIISHVDATLVEDQIRMSLIQLLRKIEIQENQKPLLNIQQKMTDIQNSKNINTGNIEGTNINIGDTTNINIHSLHLVNKTNTKQILSPPTFIKEYEQGKLATSLSNKLYFREVEIKDILSKLVNTDLIIVEGDAGVGKSRFVLEVLNQFCETNDSYQPVCISNKGCSIHDDARSFFESDKDYIVFVDDANRSSKNYDFLIKLLHEERIGKIKIIATVRSYAIAEIKHLSSNHNYHSITLNRLKDSHIRKILTSDDFRIRDLDTIEAISTISQGNPRLAIMAIEVARKKGGYSTLNDVAKIYDTYYDSTVRDVTEFKDKTLLKVLGIISFFRVVHKRSSDKYNIFNIPENEFWNKVITLHELELVDIHANEMVKISDQILGTYFSYKVFIRDGILDFGTLIKTFFDKDQRSFRDMIFPVTRTFSFQNVKQKIIPALKQAWVHFKDDKPLMLRFLSLFWAFQEDETLAYLAQDITKMEVESVDEYIFEKKDNRYYPPFNKEDYLSVLKEILKDPSRNLPFAIEITFEYLEKRPDNLIEFIKYVKSEIVFNPYNVEDDFLIQHTFFDKLISLIRSGKNPEFYRGIFYQIVGDFLQTAFHNPTRLDRDNSFRMYTYSLPYTANIKEFRKRIWEFILGDFKDYRGNVINAIYQYSTVSNTWARQGECKDTKKKIWEFDAELIIPFIAEHFNVNSYIESKTAQVYFQKLKDLNIDFDDNVRQKLKGYKYDLSIKLHCYLLYGNDIHTHKLIEEPEFRTADNAIDEFKAYNALKNKELRDFVKDYTLEDLKKLYFDASELWETDKEEHLQNNFKESFFRTLNLLANENVDIILQFLGYLHGTQKLSANFSYCLSLTLIETILKKIAIKHIEFYNFINNNLSGEAILYWKRAFFISLKEEHVNTYYAEQLLEFISKIKGNFGFDNFDFLSKYETKTSTEKENIYLRVVNILLSKVENEEAKILFGTNFISKYHSYFDSNYEILKKIYFQNYDYSSSRNWRVSFDADAKEMKVLCNISTNFIADFVQYFHDRDNSIRIPQGTKLIWGLENHTEIFDKLIQVAKSKRTFSNEEHPICEIFKRLHLKEGEKPLDYIKHLIQKNHNDTEVVKLVFNIIVYVFPSKRIEFLTQLLSLNSNSEIFKQVAFYSNGVYSGDAVKRQERRIEFIREIEGIINNLPNSNEFLEHRIILKKEIESLNGWISFHRGTELYDYN